MLRNRLLYSLVVGGLLSYSLPTAGQTVIDGVEIRLSDLPRMRSYCNSLAAASRSSLTDDQGAELMEPSPDPASSFSQGANSMDNALTQFDLNRLTVAKCRAAGLL